jgi:crotonobetainyl-CoA:carnitine CoA-transferase CaiB-like acyl-CoA transferase
MIYHPHVLAMAITEEYEHPKAGRLRQSRAAARFSKTPPSIRRGAPALGEHTAAVLAEIGYSESDIAGLRAAGAFGAE